MKKKSILILIVCLVFVLFFADSGYAIKKLKKLSYRQRQKVLKTLDERYQRWYKVVYHISAKEERTVFLSLTNNRDRDIFVRTFWQQRDPTPGTQDNEYQIEIEKRFAYVQKYFSRGSSKPGWMTDMGKFYMILGKPNSIERFDSRPGLYPAVVWYYFGDKTLGLPTYFSVTFYRPNNTTEWKFYNPSVEGPAALLIKHMPVDELNYAALYEKIKELAPELAMPAITMIPNEVAPGFRPPLRNNLIVSNIYESPKRKINVSYATHFLNYKGYVDVESSINYIANSKLVSVTKYDRFGFAFVNISLKPKRISVGYSEEKNQYFFNYNLSVTLRQGEKSIYEYKKNFDFYIDADKVNQLKSNGIIIHDSFPMIPGKYSMTVFAMNSVGKEFTYFDSDIVVPPSNETPVLVTPVIGYKTEPHLDTFFFSYKFNNQKLFLDTEKNFRLKENPLVLLGVYNLDNKLWETGKIQLVLKSTSQRSNFKKDYQLPLNRFSYQKDLNILQEIKEEGGLNPDYYELEVNLIDGAGTTLASQNVEFAVSPLRVFAHPMETFKKIRVDNPFFFNYTLGTQYEKLGSLVEAEKYYARSVRNNPAFKQGMVSYLNILNRRKKYTQVLVDVEKLQGDKDFEFDYNLTKATALFGMKDYKEALNHLLRANTIYDSDIRVLNLLGFTFLNLKEYQEALKVFDASLSLNDQQQFIKQTVQKVKEHMNTGNKTKTKSR
ncbi:MAG: GWxTD domain-containing protein [Candidatus Aminicenantes bacterium]|nr:GWxTD domain-containing protein [Candidatus Aminicenantes bacterium]NIM81402.1 GWxTD domain-containing protein [Candidatus Aminicenantes bacterium]NIN20811.1 GWxTD domain-containing protein [Candidatus Aminicenantes bacterium]NIN44588.1 GWxTD domain-containing protein [Candidatus Aminicenantes bacterium]NIN87413.1 GWxTD domain-containing protein [Candidatus Aminicenantes bacterium]